MIEEDDIFIHFGGSFSGPAPKEFRNFDSSPTLIVEKIPFFGKIYKKNENFFPSNVKYGDIVKGLPFKDNSVKGIYCSHVLEHLALNELRKSLKNILKMLKKDGIFRAVLPDLKSYCVQYCNNEISSVDFLKSTGLGTVNRTKSIKEMLINHYGGAKHLWMWDYSSLKKEILDCGFVKFRKAKFNDSCFDEFKLVETKHRWTSEPVIGFEATK